MKLHKLDENMNYLKILGAAKKSSFKKIGLCFLAFFFILSIATIYEQDKCFFCVFLYI